MWNIRRWTIPFVALGILIGTPMGARAASLEDLVPGEMLTDAELAGYYGKGAEGIEGGVNNNTGEIVQNNVDEFGATVESTAGAEQGFVNVFQISGDNSEVSVYILIDVNINGVDFGSTIAGGMIDGGAGGVLNVSGSVATVTATADIQTVIDTASYTPPAP